jgi:hypothetical protein
MILAGIGFSLLKCYKNKKMTTESKKEKLIEELKKGEKSGMIKDFNRDLFVDNLHKKYLQKIRSI